MASKDPLKRTDDLVKIVQKDIDAYGYEQRKAVLELVVDRVTLDPNGNVEVECGVPLWEPPDLKRHLSEPGFS